MHDRQLSTQNHNVTACRASPNLRERSTLAAKLFAGDSSQALAAVYHACMTIEVIDNWLQSFSLGEHLHMHVVAVLTEIPPHVVRDLLDDPSFSICEYSSTPGEARILMAAPVAGKASRSVALKSTLVERSTPFARYVIAHELAHAHLYNAGSHEHDDPEHAADALAAQWGFPRPATRS